MIEKSGDILEHYAELMRPPYRSYCGNQSHSLQIFQSIMENDPKLTTQIKVFQSFHSLKRKSSELNEHF